MSLAPAELELLFRERLMLVCLWCGECVTVKTAASSSSLSSPTFHAIILESIYNLHKLLSFDFNYLAQCPKSTNQQSTRSHLVGSFLGLLQKGTSGSSDSDGVIDCQQCCFALTCPQVSFLLFLPPFCLA